MDILINTRIPSVCECSSHAWIILTKGFVTLIDPSDVTLVAGKHHAHVVKHNAYARSGKGRILLHKAIFPEWDHVDHENGNGLDNRRSNLRPCSDKQNLMNMKKTQHGASKFKGVNRTRYRWRAQIGLDGIVLHLGCFLKEEDAARAYDTAAAKYFGEFARTNESLGLLKPFAA